MRLLFFSLLLLAAFSAVQAQCPPSKTPGVHVVQKGETLYRISRQYNVTIDQLRQWNSLANDVLAVCQELRVAPATAAPPTGATSGTTTTTPVFPKQTGPTHIVQRGETVAGIAQLYGYTEVRFRLFNNLKAGQEVAQGTVLKTDDCVCPPLGATGSQPVTVYETGQPAIDAGAPTTPTSIWATVRPAEATQPVPPATQPAAVTTQPETPATSFVPAEELLAKQKAATRPNGNATASTPAVSTDFKKATATFLTAEERTMVDEINLVRSNPAGYVPFIEDYLRDVRNGRAFGSEDAVLELIEELKKMKPVPVLETTECLYQAAKKHGEDIRSTGASNHQGSDGSWPWDRVRRECPNLTDGNENIVGGPAEVRKAVIILLVDAGIPSRGHRRTLLNKDWKYVAAYKIGMLGSMPNSWIQQFGR